MDIIRGIYERFPEVKKVLVYGSRAKGTFREGSDIDMAIVADGTLSRHTLMDIADAFDNSYLAYLTDISDLRALKNQSLIDHINRCGKILYERKG